MPLVRVHCTPINLEIPLTIVTETVQVPPFTILRSASLATVLLALERPSGEVYLSILDDSGTTYYHMLHTVEANGTSPRPQGNRGQQADGNSAKGHPYQALAPFLSWIDGHLLYESLNSTLYISRWEAKRSALLKRLSEVFWRTRKAHQGCCVAL